MKKKLFVFSLLFVLLFSFPSVKAENITVTKEGLMVDTDDGNKSYITPTDSSSSAFDWAMLRTSDGKVAYCIDIDKTWPTNDSMTISDDFLNSGLVYILENGYPNKTIIDGGVKDRYITQGAIYLYVNNSDNFTGVAADRYNLIPEMKRLVNGAKSVNSNNSSITSYSIEDKNMELSSDGRYYVSKKVLPSVIGTTSYTVSVSGIDGASVVDENGAAKTSFTSGEGFYVRVPSTTSAGASVNVSLSIKTKARALLSSNTNNQRVVYLADAEDTKSTSFTLTISAPKVCVDYKIVGDVRPDPALTDPTPGKNCFDKGVNYDQENKLTTRDNCVFSGWFLKENLSGEWVNGTALNNDLTLYGAWNCSSTVVNVPNTAASTPLIIVGIGFLSIAVGAYYYFVSKKHLEKTS